MPCRASTEVSHLAAVDNSMSIPVRGYCSDPQLAADRSIVEDRYNPNTKVRGLACVVERPADVTRLRRSACGYEITSNLFLFLSRAFRVFSSQAMATLAAAWARSAALALQ